MSAVPGAAHPDAEGPAATAIDLRTDRFPRASAICRLSLTGGDTFSWTRAGLIDLVTQQNERRPCERLATHSVRLCPNFEGTPKPMINPSSVGIDVMRFELSARDMATLEQMDEDIAKAAVNGGRWGGASSEARGEAVESPQAQERGSRD